MAVADSYAAFQGAQAVYYKAAELIERGLPSDLARAAFSAAGKALTSARHAAQTTRLIADARSAFPPAVIEEALKAAGAAAQFAAQSSTEASNLVAKLVGAPLAAAGPRTREETARLEVAIEEALEQQPGRQP